MALYAMIYKVLTIIIAWGLRIVVRILHLYCPISAGIVQHLSEHALRALLDSPFFTLHAM